MQRFVFAVASTAIIALAACGQATDDRPASIEYITQAIMVPYCANAQCHSAFRRAGVPNSEGYALDTVENVRDACTNGGLVAVGDPEASFLVTVLTRPGGDMAARMPYDAPLPDVDIELIKTWIRQGADGL